MTKAQSVMSIKDGTRFFKGFDKTPIEGFNFKADGQMREWHATGTGLVRIGKNGDRQVQVVEFERALSGDTSERWINWETFSGTVGETNVTHGSYWPDV